MKKRHPLLYVNLLAVLLSVACNMGGHTRSIHSGDGKESLDIEYKGEVFFNPEETAIDEISPGGYIKYKKNDKKFIAEPNDSGNVNYKLYFDGKRVDITDTAAKEFFKTAMEEITDHYER